MEIGLFQNVQWPEWTDQETQYRNTIAQTLRAEELGFRSAFFVEHHFTRHGVLSSTLALLGYLAARTSKLRLGTAVLVLPFHDPVRVAEEAATVDVLSDGRLELGVGRGFQWAEFNGFRVPMEESMARYEEAIDVIIKGWTAAERFSYSGTYWSYDDIVVEPSPVQKPHPPVWVAAGSRDSVLKVGRQGRKLQMAAGLPWARIPETIDVYKQGLSEGGHDFVRENVMLARLMYIAPDKDRAWQEAAPHLDWFRRTAASVTNAPGQNGSTMPPSDPNGPQSLNGLDRRATEDDNVLFCSPHECIERVEAMEAMGIGHLIVQDNFGGVPHERVMTSLQLFAEEVMPSFHGVRNSY